MNEPQSSETVVEDVRIKALLRLMKRPLTFILAESERRELIDVLKELQRHRKLEHDHYWGDDDD